MRQATMAAAAILAVVLAGAGLWLHAPDKPRAALERAFARTIAFYLSGEKAARGCFLVGTALAEAVNDAEVRDALLSDLRGADRILEARFAAARSGRKKAATSVASAAGCSSAAKCPPRSIGFQRRMSV